VGVGRIDAIGDVVIVAPFGHCHVVPENKATNAAVIRCCYILVLRRIRL
jgi:hypothetical protein